MAIDLPTWCTGGIGNKAELALQVASNTVSPRPFAGSVASVSSFALECLDCLLGYGPSGWEEASGVDGIGSGRLR
jgi:hypothetical protein